MAIRGSWRNTMYAWKDRLNHLILITGHGVFTGGDTLTADSSWHIQPFQKGEPPYFLEHIRIGIELASRDPSGAIVFSGGQTKQVPISEGQSYYEAAKRMNWLFMSSAAARATTEEFARDSFENLLFSICRFREFAGRYPEKISVVSWEFKRERFEFHREALGFPHAQFEFIGPNNPENLAEALAGEAKVLADFKADPYGVGPALSRKRTDRNPGSRQHGYERSCPELADLLLYSSSRLFDEPLPWTCDLPALAR